MLCPSLVVAAEPLTDYRLHVAFDIEQKQIKGIAEITVPVGASIKIALEDFSINALKVDDAIFNPASIGGELSIEKADQLQKISIHYSKIFKSPYPDLISSKAIALTESWYPFPDRDCQYSLQAVIPDSFEAVSEADKIITEAAAGNKIITFEFSKAARWIHFLAGPYIVGKEMFGAENDKELYTYFFPEDADLADHYRQKAHAYLERYEKLIGPYPYKRFSIVENRLPTGYAMPSFTLLGQAVVRSPFIVDTSLGHEVLHSWFGNAVRVDLEQGNWSEGLTTYLADQAYAADRKNGQFFRKGQLVKYQSYVNEERQSAVKDFKGGNLRRDASQFALRAVGYGKTSMIFHMLSEKIGQQKFIEGLQNFYTKMNGKVAGWQDILESFQEVADADLNGFFAQWLNRKDLPGIAAKDILLREKDGELILSFLLTQDAEPPYSLDVPIVLKTDGGVVQETFHINTKELEVEFVLNHSPSDLIIDPDYSLMRRLDRDEMPPVWDWFNGADKRLAVINSSKEYDIFEPFIDALEKEGVEIIAANELTDEELSKGSLMFLGLSGPAPRSLFANPGHADQGFTVDIRKNPLNPDFPAVLVSADSRDEVIKGVAKLTRYGKYSYLHFEKGRVKEKQKGQAQMGLGYALEAEPLGMKIESAMGFPEIVEQLKDKRVVYIGESHTRYEDHKLQLRVIREMLSQSLNLAIGMEMFPASVQQALDDYVSGKTDEKTFLKESKYFDVWRFDYRLYREILLFARQKKIPVIGLNIEKAKTSKVYNEGGVSALAPEEMMSLPIDRDLDLPEYRQRLYEVFKLHPGRGGKKQFNGFFQAQSIWDEIMAQNIAGYLEDNPQSRMAVIAGNGHVLKNNAIPPRVKRRIDVEQAVIVTADGYQIYPPSVDFVIFPSKVSLPARALMGIVMSPKKQDQGILIQEVSKKSAAGKAGIEKDDFLLAMDEEEVLSIEDVKIFMLGKNKGDTLKLTILRQHFIFPDEKLDFELKL